MKGEYCKMSRSESVKLKDLMEELNDAIYELMEDRSELEVRVISNSFSDALILNCDLVDTENYNFYDDHDIDYSYDKNLNEMQTGRQKALKELLEKFGNIKYSCNVITDYINGELKKKPSDTTELEKYLEENADKLVDIEDDETDLDKPNEFDNKRFQ
jgi:hypothetical protein